MEKLSDEELSKITQRAEKATKGPWEWDDGHRQCSYLAGTLIMMGDTYENGEEDADFIAHSRTDIPALLSHIAALKKEAEERYDEAGGESGWVIAAKEKAAYLKGLERAAEICDEEADINYDEDRDEFKALKEMAAAIRAEGRK